MPSSSNRAAYPLRRSLFGGVSAAALVLTSLSVAGARDHPADRPNAAAEAAHARATLMATAASGNIIMAAPQPEGGSAPTPNPVEENNRYYMRLMTQIFDGAQDFSHTQTLGFARMRKGDESWVLADFGNGAVVIEKPGRAIAASTFTNSSNAEMRFRYDYATKEIGGDSAVAQYHNKYIIPQLGKSPSLGRDATWKAQLTLADLGFDSFTGQKIDIDFSREYFTHEGKDLVLIRYKVPAFRYGAGLDRTVVQWGEGVALTDPGFGEIYWNATLHRAVAKGVDGQSHPYRLWRSSVASDDQGKLLADPRAIPQTRRYLDDVYGQPASEVIPFGDTAVVDQGPINLAAMLDVVALSIAENGANQLGEMAGQTYNGPRGEEKTGQNQPSGSTIGDAVSAGNDSAGRADKVNIALTLGQQSQATMYDDIVISVTGKAEALSEKAQRTAIELEKARRALDTAKAEYEAAKGGADAYKLKMRVSDATQLANNTANANKALDDIALLKGELAQLDKEIIHEMSTKNPLLLDGLEADSRALAQKITAAEQRYIDAERLTNQIVREAEYIAFANARVTHEAAMVKTAADRVLRLEGKVTEVGSDFLSIAEDLKALPKSKLGAFIAELGDTAAGRFLQKSAPLLDKASLASNAYTTASAIVNVKNAAQNDLSSGSLQLTRDYGNNNQGGYAPSLGSVGNLGLDLFGMVGNFYAGNAQGAFEDAVAIGSGSLGDIYISGKALHDTNKLVLSLLQENMRREQELSDARHAKFLTLADDVASAKAELATLDSDINKSVDMAKNLLAEKRARREETQRQERMRLEEIARVEQERLIAAEERRKLQEYLDGSNDRLREAFKPDYPTRDPNSIIVDPKAKPKEQQFSDVPDWLLEQWQKDADMQKRRDELALIQNEILRRKQMTEDQRDAERSERIRNSNFDLEPVTFTGPKWDPPKWEPPVWVPPEFDAPDPTKIEWTKFDGDNYPGSDTNLAYGYENMSGKVATDLSRWADWLATQNVRELTRLALSAGYPNLASALNDAENIIRLSQNEGYRKWSLNAPSCGGYVGCGPSYLERWAMKRSIVSLGDLLADSRGIFSTGGLTDVGISGFNLMYLLRDFGIEDGDLVDIEITQFGRKIFETRGLFLLNAGSNFNVPLQRGVAQLVITALNEGSASPNTAEIQIKDVVRGDGTQSYSLNTGQTAVLRIESGAKAQVQGQGN